MHPEIFCYGYKKDKKRTLEDLTILELLDKVTEIDERQNQIKSFNLSEELTSLAIKELQEQKVKVKEILHKKINEL